MISSLPGLLLIIVISFVSLLIYTFVEIYIKDYLEERKRIKKQKEDEKYQERYSEYMRKLDRVERKAKVKQDC